MQQGHGFVSLWFRNKIDNPAYPVRLAFELSRGFAIPSWLISELSWGVTKQSFCSSVKPIEDPPIFRFSCGVEREQYFPKIKQYSENKIVFRKSAT